MRKFLLTLVICGFACAAQAQADQNSAKFVGHVLQVRHYSDAFGEFRRELELFTQAPANGPYSPLVDCGTWSECKEATLLSGCAYDCVPVANWPPTISLVVCTCPTFNPGAGACVKVSAFHDGARLLATKVEPTSACAPVP